MRCASVHRRVLLTILTLTFLLSMASVALAAPTVTEAGVTGPIAYELKSLLKTDFYVNTDTQGTWTTVEVLAGSTVVAKPFSGPTPKTGARSSFSWNGMSSSSTRLPSSSYTWRITVSKAGQSTVKTGKITVSRIYWTASAKTTIDQAYPPEFETYRYMIPGTANIYVAAKSGVAAERFLYSIREAAGGTAAASTPSRQVWGEAPYGKDHPLSATFYLRGDRALRYRGMQELSVKFPEAPGSFSLIFIQ